MYQKKDKVLALSMICPSDIAVGEVVAISDDLTVASISSEAQADILGTVCKHGEDGLICTVETRFRERRDDRVAAAAIDVGPFVWDGNMKAVAYTASSVASVTGTQAETFEIIAAAGGSVTGDNAETFNIGEGTSDAVKIKVGSGESQTFTLTAGATQTAANVAADFAAAVGFTASAVDGKLHLEADAVTDALEVEAVANDAYTVLGLSAAVHAVVAPVDKVQVTIGSGDPQTFTLTAGAARTASQIATEINLAASDFVASPVTGKVKFTASNTGDDITIESVPGDCYDVLGFTEGKVDVGPSHDPASVAGLVIKGTVPLVVNATVQGPYKIETGVNDKVKITVEGGSAQTFTLTAGAARTATQIAAEIDAAATDFTTTAANDKLVFTVDTEATGLSINTIAADAYDTLGLIAGDYAAPMTIQTVEL